MMKSFADILNEKIQTGHPSGINRSKASNTSHSSESNGVKNSSLNQKDPFAEITFFARTFAKRSAYHSEKPKANSQKVQPPKPESFERFIYVKSTAQQEALDFFLKFINLSLIQQDSILSVSESELKRAHRKLAKQFHPDMNLHCSAVILKEKTENFRLLQINYRLLCTNATSV
jgi:hypothetical protein